MPAFRKLGKWQWLTLLAFFISLGVAIFFGWRTYQRASYWREHRDEPLRPWMSIRYVAHSYHIPPHVLLRAIKMPPHELDRRPIGVLAKTQDRTSDAVIEDLRKGILEFRKTHASNGEALTAP